MEITYFGITVTWRDVLDIVLVTFLLHRIILLFKDTRTASALYGLVLIIATYFFALWAGLSTLSWLLESFFASLFLVIVIIFQRDIRLALMYFGTEHLNFLVRKKKKKSATLSIITEAAIYMAQRKIGALIVLERSMPLNDVTEKAVLLEARLSKQLLVAIFWPKSPLHDGAVVLRGNEIVAAGCILPLASAIEGAQDYGTRHRAAIGITEETDAIVVVVSEERGQISVAIGGQLTTSLDAVRLELMLASAMEER